MRGLVTAAVTASLVGAVAGCAEEAPRSMPQPTAEPVAARVIALLTGADSGGSMGLVATRLDLPGATSSYAGQFRRPLRTQVEVTAAGVNSSPGEVYAQVVSLGCDVPATVQVVRRYEQVVIQPVEGPDPTSRDCPTRTTTVAIVTVADP